MSAEMFSLIFAAGVVITLGSGFIAGLAWLLRRMDERFEKVDQRFDKADDRFSRVDEQIRSVQSELNEVKVAVARLEGPQQRLILPR